MEIEVNSFTIPDKKYIVKYDKDKWECTCKDFQFRKNQCKHVKKVIKEKL